METSAQDSAQDPDKIMFIIKAKDESLAQAEAWLRNKGWKISATSNAREALPQIIAMKPKYVMICMDHPSPKVRMMPKLLQQAFQMQIIAFLDATSPRSISYVAGFEYVLYPPITGTAIERMCSKIDRDKRRKESIDQRKEKNATSNSLGTDQSSIISIKGSADLSPSHINMQEQAKKALQDMMKSDDGPTIASGGSSGKSSEGASNKSFSSSSGVGPDGKPLMQPGNGSADPKSAMQKGNGSATSKSAMQEGKGSADSKSAVQPGVGHKDAKSDAKKELGNVRATASGKPGETSAENDAKEKSGASLPTMTNPHLAMQAKPRKERVKDACGKMLRTNIHKESDLKEDSGIVESMQLAVDLTASPDNKKASHKMGVCSEMLCFPVGSSHHHGYILCAMANNPMPLTTFATLFRQNLILCMSEIEKHFTAGEALPLYLTPVEFEKFAEENADMFTKFVHLDRECAVAYFDEEMPEPKLHVPVDSKMIPVAIDEVKPEKRLDFDLFLHMPVNEKFVRYGKKNGIITSNQRTKLVKRGVNAMHLHQDHRFDLFRHRLQNFMDEKITSFIRAKPKSA